MDKNTKNEEDYVLLDFKMVCKQGNQISKYMQTEDCITTVFRL